MNNCDCDRCGQLATYQATIPNPGELPAALNLCPGCAKQFWKLTYNFLREGLTQEES